MHDAPSSPKSFLRRRMYLVDPAFQWKHALTIAGIVFLVSTLISLAMFGTLHQQARMRAADPMNYVSDVTTIILLFAIGCAALTAGGVGLWSILVTHRMCGPMFVMDRCLRELTAGRLPKLRALRKNDEFKELYNTFSEAVESIRKRAKTDHAMVCNTLELARKNVQGTAESQREFLTALMPQLEKLQGDLEYLLNEKGQVVIAGGPQPKACDRQVTAPAMPA